MEGTRETGMDADRAETGPWSGIARFLHRAGALKRTKRAGWLDRGVPPAETESVADHSYRVALLAWLVAGQEPDEDGMLAVDERLLGRILLVALAHDLAESLAGDITPYDQDALPEDATARQAFLDRRHVRDPDRQAAKKAAEEAALADLLADLPGWQADTLLGAWREYEERATPVARLVRQADKLETYLQSREYLAADATRPMASFAAEVADPKTLPDGRMRRLRDVIEAWGRRA